LRNKISGFWELRKKIDLNQQEDIIMIFSLVIKFDDGKEEFDL